MRTSDIRAVYPAANPQALDLIARLLAFDPAQVATPF
jgi:hypothetical protein